MSRRDYCPPWVWWVRAGERLLLGLSVSALLEGVGERRDTRLRAGLERVGQALRGGCGVVEALRGSGMRLPMEAWCLLEGGERTGRLGESLCQVGELLKEGEQRRRELLGQLWYPGLVAVTAMGVMGLILLWVIPQMRVVGESMGTGSRLPWLTEHIGTLYGGALLGGLGLLMSGLGAAGLLRRLGGRHGWFGLWEARLQTATPLVGPILADRREARILREVGTLLGAGVSLPEALDLAARGCRNTWEREQIRQFRTRLLAGAGFPASLKDCPLIGAQSAILLEIGQEAGRLDRAMERVATDLISHASIRLQRLIRLVEPLFLLGLSGAVGGLILAYLLPMIRLLEQAGGSY